MAMTPEQLQGMAGELQKLAASWGRWKQFRERTGRKPMSVMTLLKKDKNGSLWKKHATGLPPEFTDGEDPSVAAPQVKKTEAQEKVVDRVRAKLRPVGSPQ